MVGQKTIVVLEIGIERNQLFGRIESARRLVQLRRLEFGQESAESRNRNALVSVQKLGNVVFNLHRNKIMQRRPLSKFYPQFLLTIQPKIYTFQAQSFSMRHEELVSVLALQRVEGVGDVIAKKLFSSFDSVPEIFASTPKKFKEIGLSPKLLAGFKDKSIFDKAQAEAEFIQKANIKVTTFQDEDYPERLKHCYDGPLLLFSTGNIDLKNRKIISIVGTRKATAYGNDFTHRLLSELSPLNPIVVSGFAYGIDIIAHQAAIENGLQTIGVLGNGLNRTYPKAHQKFLKPINENGGFLSEFWSDAFPAPENFVRRNRIVAGMSEATIVIESAERGGSLITANLANDYNREVFAVPGRATDAFSQGCNKLIKTQRAHLMTSAADLVYIMNWDLKPKLKPVQKQLFISLSDEEQRIYDYLSNRRELLDTIAIEVGIPVSRLSSTLLTMELKGVIKPLPGKLFEVV